MKNPFDEISERFDRIEELLRKSVTPSSPAPPSDTWFDLTQLCQYHPDKPAKPTVYAYVQKRTIPFHKKGKKLFFLKSEIDIWLKAGRRNTTIEIDSQVNEYFTSNNR